MTAVGLVSMWQETEGNSEASDNTEKRRMQE